MPGPLSPDSPPLRSRSHLEGLFLLVSCPSSAIPLFWLRLSASLISFLHIVGSRICRFVGICPWHTHVAELFAVRICAIEERPSQLFPQRFYCPIFLMYFVLRAPPIFVISLFLTILPRTASMVVGLMSGRKSEISFLEMGFMLRRTVASILSALVAYSP